MNASKRYLPFILGHFVILALCINCGNKEEQKSQQNDQSQIIAKKGLKTKGYGTKSFDAFLQEKSEVEIVIHAAHGNEIFDLEEVIALGVELFNPRYATYQGYQNTLGADQPKPEFSPLILGTETNPWFNNLSLIHISDGKEVNLPFLIAEPSSKTEINIGNGDLGMLRIFLEPGVFSTEGDKKLVMKYHEPKQNLVLTGKTTIITKKGVADELQKNLSNINYLIAADKNQEALELALETVQSYPESYSAHVALGKVYEKKGQLANAVASYRKGLMVFKIKREDGIMEYPKGLWDKINELEAILGGQKNKK